MRTGGVSDVTPGKNPPARTRRDLLGARQPDRGEYIARVKIVICASRLVLFFAFAAIDGSA
jgi:hypothetical protein